MATYEGWTNYPTWAVKLWIDNEEGSYNYWRERAEHWQGRDGAEYHLANELKENFEESNPIDNASPYADLMTWAIAEVNWDEIAKAMLSDLPAVEEETEEEGAEV
jgi:hypothetical protein